MYIHVYEVEILPESILSPSALIGKNLSLFLVGSIRTWPVLFPVLFLAIPVMICSTNLKLYCITCYVKKTIK